MMMHWKIRGWTLVGMLLAVVTVYAMAQGSIATTTVTDTIYRADGTAAGGTVIVSWPAFSSAIGQTIPSGSTSVTIGAGGALSVQLAPNAGATPIGTYYTVVYHLDDGTVSREFWVVPSSQTPVHLSAVKSTVLPTSVAMQTVSKSYVDTAIAAAVSGHPLDSSPYVLKAGDTMTGSLVLPGDPTATNEAADKHYVDVNIAAAAGGLGQKVSTLPSGTQTIVQPTGTQLQVNILNGAEYASQYVTGLGNNGIANALASPDCAIGCDVEVGRDYNSSEHYGGLNSGTGGTHVEDNRNGQRHDTYLNPTSPLGDGIDAGQVISVTSTRSSAAEAAAGGSGDPSSFGLVINHQGLTGGSNLFPEALGNVPYFKTNYNAVNVTGTYNTLGQHGLDSQTINCYGVGDCLIGSQFLNASGGFRDEADEGAHPFDLQIQEDTRVFQGTCSGGCSPGSTLIAVAPSSAAGTQGEGRYLIDKNPGKVITSGVLIGGTGQSSGPGAGATFSGTNFPVSVFLATAQLIPPQSNNIAPGVVAVAIATSGVTAGFATNTAAISAPSGVACIADVPLSTAPHNYEMAAYTVIDGTHLQMTLNKPHHAGATIAFGGLCGYGLEQTVDTVGGIRQVFPVIGSYSTNGLYYAGGLTAIVGVQGNTSAFLNVTGQIAAIARTNGLVTVTTAGSLPVDVNGLTMTISGVADQSYNGSFVVTSTSSNTLTYSEAGANSTSTGGTVAKLTGGYVLYPMAEVLGVYDTATKSVDGQLTLAANTVPWGTSDAVEEPHYYQELVLADVSFVGQTTPRPTLTATAGVQYETNVGPGVNGWTIQNVVPATNYLGNGGTHSMPHAAYESEGIWQDTMEMQAGEQNLFQVHCNSHGCGRWNSGYNLFALDGGSSIDTVSYQPQTSTLQATVRGTAYQFSPQAFTAGTINAGTVNATTLNGAVGAAQLPLFGASGSSHSRGAVPDPGVTAGTTRYLREDGTWAVPAGTGGSGGQSVGGGLSGGGTPIPGATADYNFLQGSGPVVTDNSGNGNDGTLGVGALAPTWTATGLNFTGQQQVSLPASLNGANTFIFGVYLQPLTTVQPVDSFPMLLGSSLPGSGLNLLYDHSTDAGVLDVESYILSPTIYGSGVGVFTGIQNLVSGFHVLTYTLAASASGQADHIYIDGVRGTATRFNFTSAGLQTSGNLILGSSNVGIFETSGLNGTMYRFAALPGNNLTDDQIMQISQQITRDVANRGVAVKPVPALQAAPTLQCLGDSITAGLGVSSPFCSLLSLTNQPAYSVSNWGIIGVRLQAMNASEKNRAARFCGSDQGPSAAIVFAGTNDFLDSAQTATSVMANLGGEIQTLKTAGCRVFVGTMLSRTGNDGAGASYDSAKDDYDALILTSAKSYGADAVIDFASNPLLGADGATSNAAIFQSDGIHPNQAGQQLLANAASNAMNYYFGYNQMNPHVVAAASYAMQAGDGYITAAPTANQTLTLPDCTGQSGAVYTVTNLQSTFTVGVVTGSSSQLINGLAVGTMVPVPANGSLTLRDVPNAKTVSGCHWEM